MQYCHDMPFLLYRFGGSHLAAACTVGNGDITAMVFIDGVHQCLEKWPVGRPVLQPVVSYKEMDHLLNHGVFKVCFGEVEGSAESQQMVVRFASAIGKYPDFRFILTNEGSDFAESDGHLREAPTKYLNVKQIVF